MMMKRLLLRLANGKEGEKGRQKLFCLSLSLYKSSLIMLKEARKCCKNVGCMLENGNGRTGTGQGREVGGVLI